MTNGGLAPTFSPGLRRSRRKNCPSPARKADLPSPLMSQARPSRGAKLLRVLREQRPVRARRAPEQTCRLTPVLPGRLEQAVAGIAPERRVERRGIEAHDLVVGRVGVVESGIPDTVVEGDPRDSASTSRTRRTRGPSSAAAPGAGRSSPRSRRSCPSAGSRRGCCRCRHPSLPSPVDPQNAEFSYEPKPPTSSFFLFVLNRPPTLSMCLPNTSE